MLFCFLKVNLGSAFMKHKNNSDVGHRFLHQNSNGESKCKMNEINCKNSGLIEISTGNKFC